MNAISARRACNVGTIIDEHASFAAARNFDRTRCEFIKRARVERLFSYLKEGNFGVYRRSQQQEDFVRTGGLAARYRINDREWKIEGHR